MPNRQDAAEAIGHGVRRLCIAVDLERYSQRPDSAQIEAQRAMSGLLREAGDHGALERAQWMIQQQGDGELALLPPGIDEAYVITSLIHELNAGLHRYNRHASATARLRMRVAAHEGVTYVAEAGFAGDAINTVCRLRDSHELKDALSATRNDLVLIVSHRIYHDVICGHDAFDLPPARFRETEIVMPDKNFQTQAFIYVGSDPSGAGQAAPVGAEEPVRTGGRSQADPAPAGAGGAMFNIGPYADIHDQAHTITNNVYPVRDE
jgi:hypothetical protein